MYALRLWYDYGAKGRVRTGSGNSGGNVSGGDGESNSNNPTPNNSVFSTVYTADLTSLARSLRTGTITPLDAAQALSHLPSRLEERTVGRRPIPSTLPSHRNVYLGVVAVAALGSPVCGVTVSDANIMGMASPVENTDLLLISRCRLIAALESFGLEKFGLDPNTNDPSATPHIRDIVRLLWKEAREQEAGAAAGAAAGEDVEAATESGRGIMEQDNGHDNNDDDLLELGYLKLALYGVSWNTPSMFSRFCCSPCSSYGKGVPTNIKMNGMDNENWTIKTKMRRTNGELVRHDSETCPICHEVACGGVVGVGGATACDGSRYDGAAAPNR